MPLTLSLALPLAALITWTLALVVFAARGMTPARRGAVLVVVASLQLATPLLLPAEHGLARFLWAVMALFAVFKGVDLHVAPEHAPADVRSFVAWLLHPFSAVRRRLDREPRPPRRESLGRAARHAALALLALPVAAWATTTDALAGSFWLEHTARVVTSYVVTLGVAGAAISLARAAGMRARDVFDNPFVAVTPADFWRRYNRIVGQALFENVWRPFGGRRAPLRAALGTFFVSAVMHEYVFGVALGVQGLQTAFFLLQGLAVAATLHVRPRGAWVPVAVASTFCANIVMSVLFFASVNQLVPIWTRAPLP